MQRASIHTNLREGKEKQEIRVFPHQPEELTGISVSLSFPTGSMFRHHNALENPQTPPFILSTETGVSLEVAMVTLSRAAVTSILLR